MGLPCWSSVKTSPFKAGGVSLIPDWGVKVFPGSSTCKESAYNAGNLGAIPGSGRSPGEGNGYSLQYFCLENPMDRGAWPATVHGVTKSQAQPSTHVHTPKLLR